MQNGWPTSTVSVGLHNPQDGAACSIRGDRRRGIRKPSLKGGERRRLRSPVLQRELPQEVVHGLEVEVAVPVSPSGEKLATEVLNQLQRPGVSRLLMAQIVTVEDEEATILPPGGQQVGIGAGLIRQNKGGGRTEVKIGRI